MFVGEVWNLSTDWITWNVLNPMLKMPARDKHNLVQPEHQHQWYKNFITPNALVYAGNGQKKKSGLNFEASIACRSIFMFNKRQQRWIVKNNIAMFLTFIEHQNWRNDNRCLKTKSTSLFLLITTVKQHIQCNKTIGNTAVALAK